MTKTTSRLQKTILIVDDTPDNLRLLKNILEEHGYRVRPAVNGSLALSTIDKEKPDLILLDIMMPDMDGYEVCRLLKANQETADIPVVFLSALDDVEAKVRAFEVGGVDYISKPFQDNEVLARVDTHLSIQLMQRELQEQNEKLQIEIVQRERIETALEHLNFELLVLNGFSQILQVCNNEEDSYAVFADSCGKLFSGCSGQLLFFEEDNDLFRKSFSWGNADLTETIIFTELDIQQQKSENSSRSFILNGNELSDRPYFSPLYQSVITPLCFGEDNYGLVQITFDGSPEETIQKKCETIIDNKEVLLMEFFQTYALALEKFRLLERLQHESVRDPLTGLYNRRHMEAALEREANLAKRRGTSVGIIMMDVDHFKKFNDTHGHEAGDEVLRLMGGILKESVRMEDIACRYGGEEFIIIIPTIDAQGVVERAEVVLKRIRESVVDFNGKKLKVTSSAGAATFTGDDDFQAAITRADEALYKAKTNGRDRVEQAEYA